MILSHSLCINSRGNTKWRKCKQRDCRGMKMINCRHLNNNLGRKIVEKSLRDFNLLVELTKTLILTIFSGTDDAMIEVGNSILKIISGIWSDLPSEPTYLDYYNLFIYTYSNIIVHIVLNNQHFTSGKLTQY